MNTTEIETDAMVVLRLARIRLAGAVSIHFDAAGIAIVVASDEAARRIIEPYGLGPARDSSMVRFWVGKVDSVPVTVRIDDHAAVPAQKRTVA